MTGVWSQSVIRWAGSKKAAVATLVSLAPTEFKVYREPFCGSASVFFALRPQRAELSDSNAQLINAWRQIGKHPRKIAAALAQIPSDAPTYYSYRAVSPETLDLYHQAIRFLHLTRHSFNGIYRTNRQGTFNVPYGTRTGRQPASRHFYRCSYALRGASLSARDFVPALNDAREGDFVYIDPPYFADRSTFGEYGYGSFRENELHTLLDLVQAASSRGAQIIFHYKRDVVVAQQLCDWDFYSLDATERAPARTQRRQKRAEVIYRNYV